MASDAQLVARLDARIDKFEKEMKRASGIADKTVGGIESRFASTTIGTTLGNILGRGITGALDAVKSMVDEVLVRLEKIADAAAVAGLSMRQAFAIEQVLGAGGTAGLEKIATLLDRMQRGEANVLSKLFDANGVTNVKDAGDAMNRVVDIIARLPTLVQAREAGALFGMDAATVDRIRQVGSEFQRLREEAAKAAPEMENLARKAKDFDDAWKTAIANFVVLFKAAMVDASADLASFLSTLKAGFDTDVKALVARARDLRAGLATENAPDTMRLFSRGVKKELDDVEARIEAINKARGFPVGTRIGEEQTVRQPPPASKPIPIGGGGSAKAAKDTLDAFEREERRATERAAQLTKEAELVGATAEQRARVLETLRLEQMASRENLAIDEQRRATIDKIAAGYGKATGELEAARKAQERLQFFGNTLVDALDRATESGAKLKDIIADIGSVMKRALIQGLITGQGPFGGGTGTGLFSLLPKFQEGGLVPGRGPVPIMAHGGEVVVPRAVAQRGGLDGGLTYAPVLDMRGSTLSRPEVQAMLDQQALQFRAALPALVRDGRGRGAI